MKELISGLTLESVALLVSLVTGVVGVFVTGIIKVISAINENRKLMVAGQNYNSVAGKARDVRIKEIHILVNSRLTTALRLIVTMAKKEFDRTGLVSDKVAYEEASRELQQAEDSAKTILSIDSHPEESQAEAAYTHLVKLQGQKT